MNTPLHDAASAGDAGIVAMLLSAGAAVEARASVRRGARVAARFRKWALQQPRGRPPVGRAAR